MQTFHIKLKNEKQKTYRLIILFFVILHVIFLIYLYYDRALLTKGFIISIIFMDLSLFALGRIALQKTSLHFSNTLIEKRNFPFKKYEWDQFSNVVLKDNILTLDFTNNKLLQAEIERANINEEAFNTFAQEQLNKL